MVRKSTLVALTVASALATLVAGSPALAITGGTPDTVQQNVGVVRFTTADGRFRCSGIPIPAGQQRLQGRWRFVLRRLRRPRVPRRVRAAYSRAFLDGFLTS